MRLLIVSNRLPFTAVQHDGELSFRESVGGLVSGLSSYLDSLKDAPFTRDEYIWIGWPGLSVAAERQEELKGRMLEEFHAWPVYVEEAVMEDFYHGFCNKTLWPLFHYFPSYTAYEHASWHTYQRVNELFCEVILELAQPGDLVWIQDYHLMLLPSLLRARGPELAIGFFLHIPFPTYEIYRLLPSGWRAELLRGLLGADLLGFHTHDDAQYFLTSATRILDLEPEGNTLTVEQRLLQAGSFPISIDVQRYAQATTKPEVQAELGRLRARLDQHRAIISVDRLDYSKGILNRLEGYEIFLEQNPAWHDRVTLILVVVPSRIGVEHYQLMRKQIDEAVGRINGRYGSMHWTPIVYQYRYVPFDALTALYAASDVALITPLRDGMNLVAKEYVATRTDQSGVLILSEMAGAAKELTEAIIINPNNREELAAALRAALEMPREEQQARNAAMQERLRRYDVVKWANDFIETLLSVREEQRARQEHMCSPVVMEGIGAAYRRAGQRLLLLDYDGTLAPFAPTPEAAHPLGATLQVLEQLAADPANRVVIISGRERRTLQDWLGTLDVTLIAEHGAWVKERGQRWLARGTPADGWKQALRPVLERYVDHVPGSLVEEKEFCLVWHYRRAEPEVGQQQAQALTRELEGLLGDAELGRTLGEVELEVLRGNKVVEVRSPAFNKGVAANQLLAHGAWDFILALGDDWTDEDLFAALPPSAYSVKVGPPPTQARFYVPTQADVLPLLRQLRGRHAPPSNA